MRWDAIINLLLLLNNTNYSIYKAQNLVHRDYSKCTHGVSACFVGVYALWCLCMFLCLCVLCACVCGGVHAVVCITTPAHVRYICI